MPTVKSCVLVELPVFRVAIAIPCCFARLNSGSYAGGVIGTAISPSYFCAIAWEIRSSTN